MERIKTLIVRYSQTAFLFFVGLILIIYLGMGFLYSQQAPQQRELKEQIVKLSAVLRTPLSDRSVLEREIAANDIALTPMADNVTIAMLVSLAEKSGIDIEAKNGKFQVPIPAHGSSGSYQLISFRNIHVQGDYDTVIAFIRILDSDEKLETLQSSEPRTVIRAVIRVSIDDVEVEKVGAEAGAAAEWHGIIAAVKAMMTDNNLLISGIPNPMSFNLGRATNRMGDDPATPIFDGFPDITTTVAGKGYTGNATPKKGYLLYEHDKINSANTTLYTTANYIQTLTTSYYYTVEADGRVYRWDSPNESKLYMDENDIPDKNKNSKLTKMELKASVDVDIYFKPK